MTTAARRTRRDGCLPPSSLFGARGTSAIMARHDPVETEADRLLATTCARLGMLGVQDGGNAKPRLSTVYSRRPYSGASDEAGSMRDDIQLVLERMREMEEGIINEKRAFFEQYRLLESNHMVAKDLAVFIQHLQYTVEPRLNLSPVLHKIQEIDGELRDRIRDFVQTHNFPEVEHPEQHARHSAFDRAPGYDPSRARQDLVEGGDDDDDGSSDDGGVDNSGSKESSDGVAASTVLPSKQIYDSMGPAAKGRPALLPVPRRTNTRDPDTPFSQRFKGADGGPGE